MARQPFWKRKSLDEMTQKEWESLCDGCGRCCLNKFEDEDSGEISYTNVACRLFDTNTCKCSNYPERTKYVKDCIVLTPKIMSTMNCLPPTCAYRLLHEGRDLYSWHPLVSGRKSSVHEAGISARGRCISETLVEEDDLEHHIVKWPLTTRSRKS